MPEVQADGREQERKGNGQSHDQGAAEISQEQKQNNRDQDDALGQIVLHGVRGEMHQVAAVEKWNDLHALGQNVAVQFRDLLVNEVQRFVGPRALAQQHDAGDHVVVVQDFAVGAVNRLGELPQPDLRTLRHGGDVGDPQGRAVLGLDHGIFGYRHVLTSPTARTLICCNPAWMKLPPAFTLLLVSCCSTSPMLRPYEMSLFGSTRTWYSLVGPAEAGYVHHVRHGFELLLQHPVLNGFQLHHVEFRIGAGQRVEHDLPHRAPVRAHLRLQVPLGRVTCASRSSTFCRFQSFSDSSSKISIRLESPNSETERRCTSGAACRSSRSQGES
jgi:hypothetical protein